MPTVVEMDSSNRDAAFSVSPSIRSNEFSTHTSAAVYSHLLDGPTEEQLDIHNHDAELIQDRLETRTTVSDEKAPRARLFLHDVAMTMGAEATTVVSTLLLTSMLSRWMGAHPLSEFLLLRRVLSWILAGTLLGLATGLPRYVAQVAHRQERYGPAYFLAASLCIIPAALFVGGVMAIYRQTFARWLFGDGREAALVVALALLLFGFAIHRAVYGYYRGLLDMATANILEICNLAVMPLGVVAALYRSQTVPAMMGVIGILTALISVLFAVPVLLQLHKAPARKLPVFCGELLRYGLPRVPGEFGAAALTAIGPMLAAHFLKLTEVSPLLLGLNMLMVVGYAAGPLGIVLLSKVSMMLGQNQKTEVQARLRLLLAAVKEVSVFTCIQLAVFADVVVRAWVGPGFLNEMVVIRLVLLAIPPYLFFVALRSTIDAVTVKPYNTANVLVSLMFYLVLIAAWIQFSPGVSLLAGIAGSLLGSLILLGVLTARTFRRFYGIGVPWKELLPSFAAAAALGAGALAIRLLAGGTVSLSVAVFAEIAMTAAYLTVLAKRGSGWISYLWNVGILRRADWPADVVRS